MRHSPEALLAFAQAASLGSFSAAARRLGKSQSTISSAIANLEIDLGVTLFDRSSRKPTLTAAGQAMLTSIKQPTNAQTRAERIFKFDSLPTYSKAPLKKRAHFNLFTTNPHPPSGKHEVWTLHKNAASHCDYR